MPSTKECGKCHVTTSTSRMGVVDGVFYSRVCNRCLSKPFNGESREYDRDRQRENNAADILQPWEGSEPNEKFVKRYPEQSKDYFDKNTLRKI